MANVEVREVVTERGETGVGQENRKERTWQLGADVDGVFVPFATVNEAAVDRARRRAEREQASRPPAEQSAAAPHDPSQPQTGQTPPDQNVAASQASATAPDR